jgi:hypothetical protein
MQGVAKQFALLLKHTINLTLQLGLHFMQTLEDVVQC